MKRWILLFTLSPSFLNAGSLQVLPNYRSALPPLYCALKLGAPEDEGKKIIIKDEVRWTNVLRALEVRDLPFAPLQFFAPRLQIGLLRPDRLIQGTTQDLVNKGLIRGSVVEEPVQVVDLRRREVSTTLFTPDSLRVRTTSTFEKGKPQTAGYVFREPGLGLISARIEYDGKFGFSSAYLATFDNEPGNVLELVSEERQEGLETSLPANSFLLPEWMLGLSQLCGPFHKLTEAPIREIHFQTKLESSADFKRRPFPLQPDPFAFEGLYQMRESSYTEGWEVNFERRLRELFQAPDFSFKESVRSWNGLAKNLVDETRYHRVKVVEISVQGVQTFAVVFAEKNGFYHSSFYNKTQADGLDLRGAWEIPATLLAR